MHNGLGFGDLADTFIVVGVGKAELDGHFHAVVMALRVQVPILFDGGLKLQFRNGVIDFHRLEIPSDRCLLSKDTA